jgi:hypothetical protein
MGDDNEAAREKARIGRVEQLRVLARYERGERVSIPTQTGQEYVLSKADFVKPVPRFVRDGIARLSS